MYISYLELYNEQGYDLLYSSQDSKSLEDLPKVSILEDEHGNYHLKNLSMHPAENEDEALNLLFLGDTNRAIAETPMNMVSFLLFNYCAVCYNNDLNRLLHAPTASFPFLSNRVLLGLIRFEDQSFILSILQEVKELQKLILRGRYSQKQSISTLRYFFSKWLLLRCTKKLQKGELIFHIEIL
jgi:hypothetical protein